MSQNVTVTCLQIPLKPSLTFPKAPPALWTIPNFPRPQGATALSYAASAGKAECTKLLLDHGATVDLQANNGSELSMGSLDCFSTSFCLASCWVWQVLITRDAQFVIVLHSLQHMMLRNPYIINSLNPTLFQAII